mmetsp:Transcript_44503/g.65209  ORF Transcript_44503/g.65209 Transcript_44503/m.65209 type:complete len:209 (-) Transcript_44503:676-1302(-)
MIKHAIRARVTISVAVEGQQPVYAPSMRLHLRSLVARQRRQKWAAGQHFDAREFTQRAPVRIFIVRVAMTHAQPTLTLRCLYVAHIAEAVGAVLLVVVPFDTHTVFDNAVRAVHAMSTRVRKFCTEGSTAAYNDKLVFIRVLHSTIRNVCLYRLLARSLLLLLLRRRRRRNRLRCRLLLLLLRRKLLRRKLLLLLHHVWVTWHARHLH